MKIKRTLLMLTLSAFLSSASSYSRTEAPKIPEDSELLLKKLAEFEKETLEETQKNIVEKRKQVAEMLQTHLARETQAGSLKTAVTLKKTIEELSSGKKPGTPEAKATKVMDPDNKPAPPEAETTEDMTGGDKPDTPENLTDINKAWVQLYHNKALMDHRVTVKAQKDIRNLDDVKSDDGKKEFGRSASSVRFQIPKGWKLVLYDAKDFKGETHDLIGTGKVVEVSFLETFNDKCTSFRWERDNK